MRIAALDIWINLDEDEFKEIVEDSAARVLDNYVKDASAATLDDMYKAVANVHDYLFKFDYSEFKITLSSANTLIKDNELYDKIVNKISYALNGLFSTNIVTCTTEEEKEDRLDSGECILLGESKGKYYFLYVEKITVNSIDD